MLKNVEDDNNGSDEDEEDENTVAPVVEENITDIQQINASSVYKLTRGNEEWFEVKQFDIKNLRVLFHYSNYFFFFF